MGLLAIQRLCRGRDGRVHGRGGDGVSADEHPDLRAQLLDVARRPRQAHLALGDPDNAVFIEGNGPETFVGIGGQTARQHQVEGRGHGDQGHSHRDQHGQE